MFVFRFEIVTKLFYLNKLFLCLKIWKPISMVQQGYKSSGTGHNIQQ